MAPAARPPHLRRLLAETIALTILLNIAAPSGVPGAAFVAAPIPVAAGAGGGELAIGRSVPTHSPAPYVQTRTRSVAPPGQAPVSLSAGQHDGASLVPPRNPGVRSKSRVTP